MCHFYANPLSVFVEANAALAQPQHFQALRTLQSFREQIEASVGQGSFADVKPLLEDDDSLLGTLDELPDGMLQWFQSVLQSLELLSALGVVDEEYSELYIKLLEDGIDLEAENSPVVKLIQKMQFADLLSAMARLCTVLESGDSSIGIPALEFQAEAVKSLHVALQQLRQQAESLAQTAGQHGNNIRSTYNSQKQVLRATVVAQKVQLSHDSATLTAADKEFTAIVDKLVEQLTTVIRCEGATGNLWHEVWLYDSKLPLRDVFVPRPRTIFERCLSRPHDYLACACCSHADGAAAPSLPPAALLYHLYLETGNLINVADLWSAFFAMVGDQGEGNGGYDEREALVIFYQALADLRALGFVRATRKKDDHIAKLKWL